MADQVLGGAFLSVVFDRIASKEVLDLFRGEKVINKLLAKLKSALRSANALLNDAEEKQLRDQDVRKWLQEIKEVFTKADNVTDKISTEVLRRKVEGSGEYGGSTSALISRASKILPNAFDNVVVRSEIEEILDDLSRLLQEKDFLGLQKVDPKRPSQRPVAPFVEESGVYGREDDKRKIIDLLLSDDSTKPNVSVIPIVGMGGIGKTTLAQLVYRDSSVIEHFNLKVWVTVSDEFDVFGITKVIFENITERDCHIKDLYKLQSELIKALEGKKFLFILDDVWNENYDLWDALKSSFVSKARGSRIIVTTRSKIVASKMGDVEPYSLEIISDDHCWDLFAKHVFNNANSDEHPELKRIGKEIVKKCKGLPLAVRSIAGVLRSVLDPNEWRSILESDFWDLELRENISTNVLPALFLSYQYLPLNLKRCFAYLSIFPKDHEFFDREKIILLWMAEGLLQHENQKRAEDVGEEYLNTLISRSFFQRQYWDALVMHDLMHDLALFVSGSDKCWRTLLDLPRSFDADVWNDRVQLRGGEYLRALSLSTSTVKDLPASIGNRKHLRYLDLFRTVKDLPSLIDNRKHLRYLDLSGTDIEGLPSSLCTLYNLQTLLLVRCRKLTHLPTNMCHLINLRHIDIRYTSLKEMPPQMCAMTNLQTLSYFVLREDDGSRIKDLGELQFLRGSFRIAGLQNVMNVGDVKVANLKNKKHLSKLVLQWKSMSRDPEREVEVLNALEPHSGLNEVRVMGYGGTKFPNWVARQSFHDMVIVRLTNCRNCSFLPPFGQLPSLKELEIKGMDKVAVIGDDFCGTPCSSTCNPFPCLEGLFIYSMEALEKWAFTGADQEGAVLFPRLKRLDIRSCNKLSVGLPAGCFPALEQIEIRGCESMVSVFPGTRLGVQEIDTSYPSLQSIRVMRCGSLESFSDMGLPSHLNYLRIYVCGRLISNRLSWDLQRLSSLESLVLVESDNSEEAGGIEGCSFPEEGLLPTSLNGLTIDSFKKLKGLNGKGLRHLTSLRRLSIVGCTQLECLPEEGLPRSLTELEICACPLLEERCQRGRGQDWPKIQHIPTIRIE